MHAPSEIANLQFAADTRKEVFRLDVPMDNMFAMQVYQRIRHLVDTPRTSGFREPSLFQEPFIQLSFDRKLEHQKDPGCVEGKT